MSRLLCLVDQIEPCPQGRKSSIARTGGKVGERCHRRASRAQSGFGDAGECCGYLIKQIQ